MSFTTLFINQNLYPGEFLFHQKQASSELILDLIWTHSNIIADIATWILDHHQFDKSELPRELVIQAALLHDIGAYHCGGFEWIPGQPHFDRPYIQHGIVGAWILQQAGYHPHVIQTAYCHSGVGLTAEDIRSHGLELPEQDFIPLTPLQKFITYCSKFHSKTPQFRSREQIRESLEHYGQHKVELFDQLETNYGTIEISPWQQKYQAWEKTFLFKTKELTKAKQLNLNPAGITASTSQ